MFISEAYAQAAGAAPGRRHVDEVTVFDSVGFALEDLATLGFLRDAAIDALRRGFELPDEALESDIFRARARSFLVDNESGKSLLVRIGGEEHELASTSWNGHTDTDLRLAAAGLRPDAAGMVPIEVITRPGDDRRFASVAFLLADSGVSVVSYIDDTVKISEVRDKQKLLRNTFMHEFQAVPGMAEVSGVSTWEDCRGRGLARALIGKKKGTSVEVVAPGGAKAYEITKVDWK